ncbi:MAG TPA: hypothetical protein VJA82_14375 [Sediminibacterium sp.]|uniref:hypothetical protein n=1 Tax=Sediminibacterium sp. TaxID=1917865 RepID=UPI00269CF8FE|nr:hypothetical protein [Sediminibacterium sp.]HLD54491.1 hypothetical protein [Sediminibacterium sp.]
MKIVVTIICQLILVTSFAQFRLHTKWVNNLTVSSGPNQGLPRIARELIFATPEANTLKMIDPFSVIPRPTKPISFDMENGVYVNNVGSFDFKTYDPAKLRYVIALPSIRLSDIIEGGRKKGRAKRVYLAFYKLPFDSTKLAVVEKHTNLSWTIDNKSPRIFPVSGSLEDFDKIAVNIDSVIFTAAAGTNTGINAKSANSIISKFQPTQSLQVSPTKTKMYEDIFKDILEPNDENLLNPLRTSTSFRLTITLIENLRIDNADEAGFKNLNLSMTNKGEYYGTLNATVKHQSSVITNLTIFDSPIKISGDSYAHFTYWGPNERRPVANSSSIFTIPRANFETSKLFIIGGLYEGNLVAGPAGNYSTQNNFAIISSTDNSRNIFLKDLKNGANSYIISKNGVDYWKIYFDIIAIN